MMKKLLALMFAMLLACSAIIFAACDNGSETEEPQPNQIEFTFDDYTYGETPSTPVVTKEPLGGAAITYTYEGRGDTTYAESSSAPTNAGEYTVTGTTAATDEYETAEYSVNFTVAKAENRLKFTFADYVTGQTASTPTVTETPYENASVSYTYKGRNTTEYAESSTAPTAVGEYTVTGTAAATANYNAATSSVDFKVLAKAVNQFEFTFADYTFGAAASTPVVTSEPLDGAVITYTYIGRGDTEYAESDKAPVNAGTYTIKAVVANTDDYDGLTVTHDFVVNKADQQIEFTFAGYAYGETASTPVVTKEPFGDVPVVYSYAGRNSTEYEASATAPALVGEYTVTATVAETDNYKSATYSVNFAIVRAAAAANEIEFFTENSTDSQINPVNADKEWLDEYKGEKGVIKLSFSSKNVIALNIAPRLALADYQKTGYAVVYLKVFVTEDTTGLTSINIMSDGRGLREFTKGEWQIITFNAKYFEDNYEKFAAMDGNNFLINGSSATGTMYISEFGYLTAEENEIEFFGYDGSESQIIAAGVTSKTWVDTFAGENGVVKLDFTNRGAVAFDIIPRSTLAHYTASGLARVYLKVFVTNETTGLAGINILGGSDNKKTITPGAWQIVSFNASLFESNYDKFAYHSSGLTAANNGFLLTGTNATGTIYIAEFGYVPAASGEVENFDDEYALASTYVAGASADLLDEFKGETGVLQISFTDRSAVAFDFLPRISKSAIEAEGLTKLTLKIFISEDTTGLSALKLGDIAETKSLSTTGEWITIEWSIDDFISSYGKFEDDKQSNAFLMTGTAATGTLYIASISVS